MRLLQREILVPQTNRAGGFDADRINTKFRADVKDSRCAQRDDAGQRGQARQRELPALSSIFCEEYDIHVAIRGAQPPIMSRPNHQGKPTPALETVGKSSALGRVLSHAQRILDLDEDLAGWLDAPLKAHCRVIAAAPGRLVLEVESPVWAQRLRFLLPDLGAHFRREVTMRVAPHPVMNTSARENRARLSHDTAAALNELATVTENPELSAVLRRLAEHTG